MFDLVDVLCIFLLQYNFEGRNDLVKFINTAQKAGLYVVLRIGPYICAEWSFGYPIFSVLSADLTVL